MGLLASEGMRGEGLEGKRDCLHVWRTDDLVAATWARCGFLVFALALPRDVSVSVSSLDPPFASPLALVLLSVRARSEGAPRAIWFI